MTSYGVTDEGFLPKPLSVYLEEFAAEARLQFGDETNTSADSVLGQIFGILGAKFNNLELLIQAAIAARTLDSSSGAFLDENVALGGVERNDATRSQVPVRFNLDGGVTLPSGRIVAVGPNGAQFRTTADITNSSAFRRLVAATLESVDAGPIEGPSYAIDSIITSISGWSAKAAIETQRVAPFNLSSNPTMRIYVDDDPIGQLITFTSGSFANAALATASEVATFINNNTTGCTATALANNSVIIESDTNGAGSSIRVSAGAAAAGLGLSCALSKGMNPDLPATKTATASGTFASVGGQTLILSINGGAPINLNIPAGSLTTAFAVARALMTLNPTEWAAYDKQGQLLIETTEVGAGITLEVIGGTANATLGFSATVASGTSGTAVLGTNIETDSELKARYDESFALAGSTTVPAIRAAVRAVTGVTSVIVYENPTDTTDVNGLPPYMTEVVVDGGSDADVAAAIASRSSGGQPFYRDPGANGRTITVTDDEGFAREINFSRVAQIPIYMAVTVQVDPGVFGAGDSLAGAELVKAAIKVLFDATQSIGIDVTALRYRAAAFDVQGVLDVPVFTLGTAPAPVGVSNIAISVRERATISTANIAVTVTT